MYSKTAKATMHEIPWNAKATFSSASVISETLYADKIGYFLYISTTHLELVLRLGLGPLRNVSRPAAVVYFLCDPISRYPILIPNNFHTVLRLGLGPLRNVSRPAADVFF